MTYENLGPPVLYCLRLAATGLTEWAGNVTVAYPGMVLWKQVKTFKSWTGPPNSNLFVAGKCAKAGTATTVLAEEACGKLMFSVRE
jgi:hypothetical protein